MAAAAAHALAVKNFMGMIDAPAQERPAPAHVDDDVPLGASPDDNGVTDADLVDVETRMVVNKAGDVEAVEVRTLSGS